MRTYGTATLPDGRNWVLHMEPHVALRFKRMFPQVDKKRTGALVLSASEDNCRDLEWFLERYPLEFDPDEARDRLKTQARAFDKRAETAEAILSGRYEPTTVKMALAPRSYQQQAADLCHVTCGLLVGDEAGLGKTVTAITLLAQKNTKPAVVVVYPHLTRQWAREIQRFLPGTRVHIAKKGNPSYLWEGRGYGQTDLFGSDWPPDVLIVPYSKLDGWSEVLSKGTFKTAIFDEVQELRRREGFNPKTGMKELTKKYAGALALARSTQFIMGLSATPIYNYGAEYFNVLDIIRPGIVGTEREFLTEWCDGAGDKARVNDPKAFGMYLRERSIFVRRTRGEVGRELPPLTILTHEFDADPEVLAKVDTRAAELARVFLDSTKGIDKMESGGELNNLLRQQTGLAKAPYVAEFVRMLIEEHREPVVLYGWHRSVYDLWADYFKDLQPAWYTGHESIAAKEREKQRFIEGKTPLMIISLRAGAGIDGLQDVARRVVFGELDWSPGVHEQNIWRVHRDGQKEPTLAYYMLATDGADPTIADVLHVKRAQIEYVRDPTKGFVMPKEIDPDHIKKLATAYLARRRGAE